MENNNEKNHFFIGNIFNDINQIKLLKIIQKKLKNKYALRNYHFNNKIYANLIYIGYLDINIAKLLMNNIFNSLLTAISNNIQILNCSYTNFKLSFDKSYYKISLNFTDTNNLLKNIIIPFLMQQGIQLIYPNRKKINLPIIDLIYFKNSNILKNKENKINISLPTNSFNIDNISLIKGSSVRVKTGLPSIHDQMNLEEVIRYNLKD
jgi:hypothetical protein